MAGGAGSLSGELRGGAEIHADVRLWQQEVRSVCKTAGEAAETPVSQD